MNLSKRMLQRRKSRGQAAVELSLLGIIIVPTFLYILFIDDLLRFRLDQQEAMITSGWDFTTLNYDYQSKKAKYLPTDGNSFIHSAVQGFARYQFYDHSVATPRRELVKKSGKIGGSEHHHNGVGAQQCWLVGGEQNQVTCGTPDTSAATNYTIDLTKGSRADVNGAFAQAPNGKGAQGGVYSCKGRVGVLNHWLPSGTLFFSKVELSSRQYYGVNSATKIDVAGSQVDTVGGSINGSSAATATYHLPADTYGVLTNPWAMADQDDVDPTKNTGALYKNVDLVYNSFGPNWTIKGAIAMYPAVAVAKGLLGPGTLFDAGKVGDNMATPQVGFTSKYNPQIKGYQGGSFYSSQFWDFSKNPVQKSYQKRGTFYLGSNSMPPP